MKQHYNLLIVDDEPALLDGLRREISRVSDHYVIHTANSARKAIQALEFQPFDILLTDILMPDQDGLELISKVRSNYPSIKIITMSGGGTGDPELYLGISEDFGSHDSIEKPFSIETLISKLEKLH